MYQNIFYSRKDNTIHLWDDEQGHCTFEYPKYAYRRKQGGEFKSLYGDELEKVYNFDESTPDLFESDVQPELRVLLDAYPANEDPSKNHRVAVIDIETSVEGGFPNMEEGDKAITAIALYDQSKTKYYSFVLDPDQLVAAGEKDGVVYKGFRSEESLLLTFLDLWEVINPTIVTGWNTNNFDLPYMFVRIKAVLGKDACRRLSPVGIAYQGKFDKKMKIAGISCLDYIDLYKKFLGVEKPSYSLGNVAKDEELKNQKLTYRGSLEQLYKEDLHRFIEYNLVDVKVVVELDKKYDFIYLARSVCHKGHIPYEWFQMSSRFIDGAILDYLHSKNLIAPNKPIGGREEMEALKEEGEDGFTGAFVKEPVPGLYDWIYSADITSLYPSVIMSLNISPETKTGKVDNWDYKRFHKGEMQIFNVGAANYTLSEMKDLLKDNRISISSNGVMYRQDFMGVVPTILDTWFKERVEYRELAKKFKNEGNKEKEEFYDRRQKRQKIFLNSVYGTLGLPIFRFYDRDNAEATTLSGQTIIRSAETLVNHIYQKKFKDKGKPVADDADFVKYIDTDSLYISASPLAELEGNVTDMTQFTIDTVTHVAGEINKFYEMMVPRVFNIKAEHNRIKIVGDVVASKSMWMAKKRYAMLKVYDMEKNAPVKDKTGRSGKLEVKGIDTVRSSFPAAFRKFASETLDYLLRDGKRDVIDTRIMEFEESLDSYTIFELGKTTSAKFISGNGETNYNPKGRKTLEYMKGTPVGVKGALAYNDLLKIWELDKKVVPIQSGQKIKWVYLLPNDFNIEVIALKADDTDPDKVLEFVTTYIDRMGMYKAELFSKLENMYEVIGWKMPNRASQLASTFFNFDEAW
jgi:DNA polymerase elongation subunit (family B)